MTPAAEALLDTLDATPHRKRRARPTPRRRRRAFDLTNHLAACNGKLGSRVWRDLLLTVARFYPQDTFSAAWLGEHLGCHPTTVRRVADKIAELTGGGLKVTYWRARKNWTLRFQLGACEPPPERATPQKPRVSDCVFADKSEATSSSFSGSEKKTTKKRQRGKKREKDTGKARSARPARARSEPAPQTAEAPAEPIPADDRPPAAEPPRKRRRDSASMHKHRRACWLEKLTQYAQQHGQPAEVAQVFEAKMAAETGPFSLGVQQFLDRLTSRMRAAELAKTFKAVLTVRFKRRRRTGGSTGRRTPAEQKTIRQMLINKHTRFLISRRLPSDKIAEYMVGARPWIDDATDAEAKELVEEVDHWMRRKCGFDDMAGWKAQHPDELGKVRKPGDSDLAASRQRVGSWMPREYGFNARGGWKPDRAELAADLAGVRKRMAAAASEHQRGSR